MSRARSKQRNASPAKKVGFRVGLQDLGIGLLFDHMRDGIVVADVELDQIVLWNNVAEQLFGYTAEEAIGKPVTLIMPDRFKCLHLEGMNYYRKTGKGRIIDADHAAEVPGLHKSGNEFDIELSLSPIPTRIGKHRFVLAVIRDVTDRKRAQRALAQQMDLLERVVGHVPASIAFLDRDLVYRWDNVAHSRMLGIPRGQIIGRRVIDVLPEAAPTIVPLLHGVLSSEVAYHARGLPIQLRQGDQVVETHWDISYVPVPGTDEAPGGILSMATEVSERVALEVLQQQKIEQLQQVDTLKDQFLGILSHELRTPLQAVTGFGSLLEDEVAGPLNPTQRDFIHKMLGASDALLALVNDMLDMSSIRAGKFETNPTALELGPLIERTVSTFVPLAEEKGITLTRSIPPDLPCIIGDAQRIAQVLTNLLHNAIKFTPSGGRVMVGARAGQTGVMGCVADTGIGIPSDQVIRIFQPFTQVDMSSTRVEGGIGLGLSICKAIVDAHHGRIGVRRRQGGGSLFWFWLPLEGAANG